MICETATNILLENDDENTVGYIPGQRPIYGENQSGVMLRAVPLKKYVYGDVDHDEKIKANSNADRVRQRALRSSYPAVSLRRRSESRKETPEISRLHRA